MLYIELFLNFIMIGALSFGGGYGTLSLIEEIAIDKMGWITHEQLYDVITISEITPGGSRSTQPLLRDTLPAVFSARL